MARFQARIGDLRQQVIIQQRSVVADGPDKTVTWSTRATVMASVLPLSGSEALTAAQLTSGLTTAVLIRHRTDVSAKDRVLFGSRVLQIESYEDPDGMKRFLRLLCSEVQT
jgi:SPP1 family predicted phage head-tail adaptor